MEKNNLEKKNKKISLEKNNNNQNNTFQKINSFKIFTKKNILFFFFPIIIFTNIYFIKNNPTILELEKKIKFLEFKFKKMKKELVRKKIGIAFISQHIYLNGIGRLLTVLCELLAKTGKYDVYIINEVSDNSIDFNYNKKIKRIILKNNEYQKMKDFDEENDIQIYILNNELGSPVDIYHSFGKKVIGIFHGVFLSCIFNNFTEIYK